MGSFVAGTKSPATELEGDSCTAGELLSSPFLILGKILRSPSARASDWQGTLQGSYFFLHATC